MPYGTPASPSEAQSSSRLDAAHGASSVHVRVSALSDVGQVREHNEDNFLVADLTLRSRNVLDEGGRAEVGPQGLVFAVCDGMGGAAAGEVASQLAVDIVFERLTDDPSDRPIDREVLARRLVKAVESAGLLIFHEARSDRARRGMGTTITAAALVDSTVFFAQVGDSRAYILRGDKLVQVTRDQSLVNQLIEAGQLTEQEAETFEHNNIILQALGTSESVQVDLTYADLRRGDTLMLCSDGLSGMVRFEEIRTILRSSRDPSVLCHTLTERANQAGGHDNVTVIVATFDGELLKPPRDEASESDEHILRYRKYALDRAVVDVADKTAPVELPAVSVAPESAGPSSSPKNRRSSAPTEKPAASATKRQSIPAKNRSKKANEQVADRIDLPGDDLPLWLVATIVLSVVAALGAWAWFTRG